ncbi:MAG: hypothetical protein ACK41D_10835 [Rubricoccaceae bacterium]
MPRLSLALLPLLLLACRSEPEPAVEVEPLPSQEVAADLLGTWVVTRVDGNVPSEEVRLQFSPQGELVRMSGSDVSRGEYSLAADDRLTITDATGTRLYTLQMSGNLATLRHEDGSETLEMSRLAGVDVERLVPSAPGEGSPAAEPTPGAGEAPAPDASPAPGVTPGPQQPAAPQTSGEQQL